MRPTAQQRERAARLALDEAVNAFGVALLTGKPAPMASTRMSWRYHRARAAYARAIRRTVREEEGT